MSAVEQVSAAAAPSSALRNSSSGEAEAAGLCCPVLGDAGLRASSVSVGDAHGLSPLILVCMAKTCR